MSTQTNTAVSSKSQLGARSLVKIGMLSAISVILMTFSIPLPFAPTFYKIDLSEVPVLVGCFAMGPIAGISIELVKILLNFLVNGTTTAGIGEIANFIIGCALVIPAGVIYKKKTTRNGALLGMVVGSLCMTLAGGLLNAYVLLPVYAKAFGMPIQGLVEMGTAVNPNITSLAGFIFLAVVPFNLLKGGIVSLIVMLIYKKISPIFRMK
ncbi:MAG: ECF transporter S component [Candidatus Ruminococcus intestinipullorum]|nr:ECF transporter S component [Candidatus Ruminococcus intestinipullorum]